MLIVGKNSYINVAEFNEYFESFIMDDKAKEEFNKLTDKQKEALLIRSAKQIDALPFVGRTHYINQELQFPRTKGRSVAQSDAVVFEFDENIKLAQAINSVALLPGSNSVSKERIRRQLDGVVSFTLDKFSETYDKTRLGSNLKLASSDVLPLLNKWLSGGYPIV